MTAKAARAWWGCVHEAGFYGSDDEFRALIVPFVEDGLAAGEPVIIGYDERKADLLRSWLPDSSAVTFLGGQSLYASPAGTIASYSKLFDGYLTEGASRIRIAGDVPHPGNGGRFEGWDRYEAALNTVWDDLPVWALCLYDTATAPAAVLEVVEQTHPRIALPGGSRRGGRGYLDPSDFRGLPVPPDPLERTAPAAEFLAGSAAEARHALDKAGRGLVADEILQDLLIGVSEAVSNALLYGQPPVTVRIWAGPGRLVVSVHDQGDGPADHLAGLVPTPHRGTGQGMGLGLWVMHQLGLDVALCYGDDGFTVRLSGGEAVR
jgi:anti-sigma regulatory factor (Ser/Thr protein kinase)